MSDRDGGISWDLSAGDVDRARDLIDHHLRTEVLPQDWVQALEYEASLDRWYLRFTCDDRDAATIYFDLRQRSLHHELYFLPMPPGGSAELADAALRWNFDLTGTRFALARDGDLYLRGRIPLEHLSAEELDRIIGTIYMVNERWFREAIRLGYGR
ncbi:MAG: type III secretion system chaperone [Actinobacteria bacterium]|nr:type III secretion system chaperone [Actinomycetota bacterium]MCB9390394.1 type III secretion system chaperone [Acidimicrobiia bacterium]